MSLAGWGGGIRLAGDRGRSDTSEFRKRFSWIALGMTLIFIGLTVRLFQLQVIDADENRPAARDNIVRRTTLATTRGIIRDRTGKVLAARRPAYNVYVVPSRLDLERVWPKLVDYIGIGPEERTRLEQLILTLRAADGKRKDQQILLKEDISRDAVANLATHEAELRTCTARKDGKETCVVAVELVAVPVRYYPYDEVGSHVLGYMAEVEDGADAGEEFVLHEYNCPIAQVAGRYQQACQCELALFRELLGTKVERTECLAKGGGKCTYRIGSASAVLEQANK